MTTKGEAVAIGIAQVSPLTFSSRNTVATLGCCFDAHSCGESDLLALLPQLRQPESEPCGQCRPSAEVFRVLPDCVKAFCR